MSIILVKKLREETGAGILDCQKAIKASNGNYENALNWIKEHTKEASKSSRVASKGMCHIVTKGSEAILFEVNAETDFVNKNEHFKTMMMDLGSCLIDSKAGYPKEALKVSFNKQTIDDYIKYISGIVKENVYLRRFFRIIKDDSQRFGTYIHQDGKIVTLVILNKENPEVAKNIAMQVAATAPKYLSLDTIDEQTILYEKMMYEKENDSNNDSNFHHYLSQLTLHDQHYLKNPTIHVSELLNHHQVDVIDFFRFELGQGIEDKLNCKLTLPCDGSVITIKSS